MRLLVTGGAGYVGSHVARQLTDGGHEVTVLDNLSTGHAWAVLGGRLVQADLGDRPRVSAVLAQGRFDAVLHFAASIVVPDSVREPLAYYRNNTVNLQALLELCVEHGVQRFVFSSTAAVYGLPETMPVREDALASPINPYGASKLMGEWMLRDTAAAATGLRYVALRYFNVAGADPGGRIGQATANATHLIKVACETALGRRPRLSVFGTDYATADGTAVRDYIHVEDLARAHLMALDFLASGGASEVLNCGYGHGHTVREVIDSVKRISGRDVPTQDAPRRPGDAPVLYADTSRIKRVLGWTPRHDDLDFIVGSALRWERVMMERRKG
ncbi:MAG TPA: UDP-glucose 4-epimerase GalE [Verrucomicrobiae bacterium]|nr:UDP-glucose 4-epimerase GalE [Verrucomicrobiae bacterium]